MRNLAIVILSVLAIMFAIYGYMQSLEAQRQFELAMQGEKRALIAEDNALMMRDRAEKYRQDAIKSREDAQRLGVELNECRKKRSSK